MSKLFLVPNTISEERYDLLPEYIAPEIRGVRVFFVEEPKSGRKLLKNLDPAFPLRDCRFLGLNEHTSSHDIHSFIDILKKQDGAVISESGCPCVADPGSELVALAHQNRIEVIPLIGPSSIILALMASGLNGQNFAFNGYLPKDRTQRIQKIKQLQERSSKEKQAQIFMEAPFHNQSLLEDILASCRDNTRLCIACDIAGPHQSIKTMSIEAWKKSTVELDKKPVLFLLQ
ncbi:MAG: SAM-dependent methyltransferase [Candidatus Omnitrophica bacterium]|nr:SAM-dependent methyltransferase [Candidatus Omnitrophota bacterium]MDE2009734.1 SAM-dependent methyltransferase [Candidatus Omnitrophota bacterium]MDE2213869.1 SAM-dependent methyltransferase [Candidatus Omnitrophota bacterium]MDE2231872.1 SAM-dependent methyltransferase [Candidatus Omnitrophota bacterium]